jgi:hypothetical protein
VEEIILFFSNNIYKSPFNNSLMGLWGSLAILLGLGPGDPGSNPGIPTFYDSKRFSWENCNRDNGSPNGE